MTPMNDDKINHLSHVVLNGLHEDPSVDEWKVGKEAVLSAIKRGIRAEVKIDEEIDRLVRLKLVSYKRNIMEGSAEWEALYQKIFDTEMTKHGR